MTYPFMAYIETVLSYGEDAKKGHLTAAMFHRDTAGHLDDVSGEENKRLKARQKKTAGSKVVDMYGRLHIRISALRIGSF
jgi:hypothetical protein